MGIDHRLEYDNSGIWARKNQLGLIDFLIGAEVAGGLWEGSENRLGKTCWQAIDSSAAAGIGVSILKPVFGRPRPYQGDNPDCWFQGSSYASFPSGEVAAVSAIVTPFILEYRHDSSWVYAFEALPLYDAIARMKVQAHWQTDVIAGFALGTLAGYYAHSISIPVIVSILPHSFTVGLSHEF